MEIEQFLREYKRIRSECTRKSYRGFLAHFNLFLNDHDLTVDAVHPADIQRFAEWVKGRFNAKTGAAGLSDVAVQSHLAAVSSYYRWRRCRDMTLRNPVAAFKYHRREPRNKMPLIDPDMVTAMGEQSDCELGNLVVKLLRGSGIRLAELVSLNRRNVTIYMGSKGAGKGPCGSVKVKGKGGKTRIVLIGAKAATALME
jgi:site-specific recombinase XerD